MWYIQLIIYIPISLFVFLFLNRGYGDEKWSMQLEFYSQLGSSSNGAGHFLVDPLHTAATVDAYDPDLYYSARQKMSNKK